MEQRTVNPEDIEIVHGDLLIFADSSPWAGNHGHLYRTQNGGHLMASIHIACDQPDQHLPVSENVLTM